MGHVAGIEVLLEFFVNPQPNLEVVYVGNLVLGDDNRAHGGEGFPGLHLVESVSGRLKPTSGPVDEVHVTEDVVEGVVGADV